MSFAAPTEVFCCTYGSPLIEKTLLKMSTQALATLALPVLCIGCVSRGQEGHESNVCCCICPAMQNFPIKKVIERGPSNLHNFVVSLQTLWTVIYGMFNNSCWQASGCADLEYEYVHPKCNWLPHRAKHELPSPRWAWNASKNVQQQLLVQHVHS